MSKELVLPEYGRNVQNMVEIAKKIEDREERNRCALSIISCMGNLFPHLRDNENFRHKLWDHLALMADFELDIDYPYAINKQEILSEINPSPIPRNTTKPHKMHYGRLVNEFLNDEDIRNNREAVMSIANYMKRCYFTYNHDIIDDSVIFDEIYEISKGKVDLRNKDIKLAEIHYEKKKNNSNNKKKR